LELSLLAVGLAARTDSQLKARKTEKAMEIEMRHLLFEFTDSPSQNKYWLAEFETLIKHRRSSTSFS
jgi:hypothetical protein